MEREEFRKTSAEVLEKVTKEEHDQNAPPMLMLAIMAARIHFLSELEDAIFGKEVKSDE